ncbi:MAG: hypothetical protein AAB270_03365, partial [Chloroflexota bacterium]
MVKRKQLNSLPPATAIAPGSEALVASFREAVLSGRHWYLALLETMGKWPATEETYKGRRFSYLIGGEAFDWLLLAERICLEVDGLLPQEEKESLLQGYPPLELSPQELRRLLAPVRGIGCRVLAITGNGDSTLARHADIVIDIGHATA